MEPSPGFWDGFGDAVGSSPGWMVVTAILIIGVLFVYAKYISPSRERIKARELDIREREAANDGERIKANAALAENMRGLRESNDTLSNTNAAMLARLDESATHSREMGADVSETKELARHTDSLVSDIHRHMLADGGLSRKD